MEVNEESTLRGCQIVFNPGLVFRTTESHNLGLDWDYRVRYYSKLNLTGGSSTFSFVSSSYGIESLKIVRFFDGKLLFLLTSQCDVYFVHFL